ncbi:hypothetical protein SERLA73DRAFT_75580 [Serpula lacrymans var. lacrymans S7.3]|uniref:Uncharacterized protein n=1 Tax=Serpula lacrymans var. lacrymans (strain S7.3) TaxID=936435 RepID=F8Q581_SERL3|nr:hypothetical protein SERLA73DRAFT_75580 [Serpula lacrymans var. lacrymans S7.3]
MECGAVLGEISQLATLCSHKDMFLESMQGHYQLYVACGYPDGELKKWLNLEELNKQWLNPLLVQDDDNAAMDPLIVLKSQLNPTKFTAGDVLSPGFPMFVHRPGHDDVVVHNSVLVCLGEDRPRAEQVETGGSEASASDLKDPLLLPVGGPPLAASEPPALSSSDR